MTTYDSGTPRPRTGPPRPPGASPYIAQRRMEAEAEPSELRSRLFTVAHWVALFLGPVVLLSLIAAGVIYVRLLHGPVSLKSFSSDIAASINAELDGVTASIDDAVLTIADDYTVELRLINLRLNEKDGDLVASAPTAAVELDKAALWRLEASPQKVFLIEPRLAVAYTAAQGFSLSISDALAGSQGQRPQTTLQQSAPEQGAAPSTQSAPSAAQPAAGASTSSPSFHRIDVARILAESAARARRGEAATSRLREFGLRDATVSISSEGQASEIHVTEATVDLAHKKRRSVFSGMATVSSDQGPWSVTFQAEESDSANSFKVTATVRDLVPSTLAKIAPGLALVAAFDTPIAGELALDLSSAGDLKTADLAIELGHGFIRPPGLSGAPTLLERGQLSMVYNAETRRLDLAPSTLDWGGSHVTLRGAMASDPSSAGEPQWHFGLESVDGMLSADEFGGAPVPIESFTASGRIIPGEGLMQLAGLSLKAGGGEVTLNGELISGKGTPSTRVEGWVSPMPLATLKAMWPRSAAPTVRTWVGTQVTQADIRGASLKMLSGRFLEGETKPEEAGPMVDRERISASIEVANLRMHPLPKSLPIEAASALIRLENSTLEVTVPDAAIIASETERLPLKGVRLTVVDIRQDAPIAELALKSQTSLPILISALNHSELHLTGQGPLPIENIDGKVDGEIKISMPLVSGGSVVKAEGKARITDIKGKSKEHGIDLQGGKVDIDVSDIGVVAKGDVIVNGVVAKLQIHRILDAPTEMQPPVRISAKLDNADRTQFGFDINDLIQGEAPVEITFTQKADGPPAVHVSTDLTDAELLFTSLAWRKAPGKAASAEFDVDASTPGVTELKNFRLVGDNIAIDGALTLDDKREVRQYSFPNFSINVVSRLSVEGKLTSDRIWKVTAKGTTFDAKDLFRSLLALGNTSDAAIKPLKPAAGVDLTVDIDTVLGHGDVSLRNYSSKMSERAQQLVAIEAQGTLDGGKPLAVLMKREGPRKLYAESTDAGQAFKLMGFYPNVQGGRLKLEVDLEGHGAAEKSGTLWVEDFRVLGDPIVSEVYSSAAGGNQDEAGGGKKQKVEREVFDFQRMRVPFSVGHGQFVLDDSYIRGPLLGASIRGKVDYNAQRVSLGGTYVPLQGINAALCDIPLVGPLVSGFDCQGVFGITYAIQGPMAQPQVLVNPLSMFTPGILRGIMEMTSPNPQVAPLSEPSRGASGERVRASSSAADGTVDGWSSQTTPAGKKK
jgi:hypothetical protein